jgi:hypothetical protein
MRFWVYTQNTNKQKPKWLNGSWGKFTGLILMKQGSFIYLAFGTGD